MPDLAGVNQFETSSHSPQLPSLASESSAAGSVAERHPTDLDSERTAIPANQNLAARFIDDYACNGQDQIGRYILQRQIGSGGMGTVFKAIEQDTGREVALKLLSSQLTADKENVDRFIREARLAAQISHPRSTFVYEAGQHQGRPYIVMELMPGKTLQDVLEEEQQIPFPRAVDYILDAIEGLLAAHHLNVVHRDVKPSNCFLTSDGRIKVGDFGIVKKPCGRRQHYHGRDVHGYPFLCSAGTDPWKQH